MNGNDDDLPEGCVENNFSPVSITRSVRYVSYQKIFLFFMYHTLRLHRSTPRLVNEYCILREMRIRLMSKPRLTTVEERLRKGVGKFGVGCRCTY